MGFPVAHAEMTLPTSLAYMLLLLGYLRRLLIRALDLFGLAGDDLLPPPSSPVPNGGTHQYHHHHHRRRQPPLFAAALIQAALPETTFASSSTDDGVGSYCAVCLHELSPGDQVRALANCRHVFHTCCLDPWVELDQRTCPLCRTPLAPDSAKDDVDRKLQAEAQANTSAPYLRFDNADLFYDDSLAFSAYPYDQF